MDILEKALKRKEKYLLENKEYQRFEQLAHRHLVGKYIGDLVYGANDGVITTFAVVAGASGANLSPAIIIILGIANLLADGISMGASNFLGKRSENDFAKAQLKKEDWEIDHLPELEVEEVREIYKKKGFSGKDLENAVTIITSNRKVWLDTMMKDELGIILDEKNDPLKHGIATFFAFVIAGAIPLFPYVIDMEAPFIVSALVGAVTLFTVGALRTLITTVSWIRGGLEMLFVGGATATLGTATYTEATTTGMVVGGVRSSQDERVRISRSR